MPRNYRSGHKHRRPLNGPDRCRLCGNVIDGGWTKNHGARVHWECATASGDPPDILLAVGDYAEVSA